MAKNKTCNKCGAIIDFVKSDKGKWVPVDLDSVEACGVEKGVWLICAESGMMRTAEFIIKAKIEGDWHNTHFTTCTKADR